MKTTLTLAPPCKLINANDRLHIHAKARLTHQWRAAATLLARATPKHAYTTAHVTCLIRFPNNRRRDVGNWYPTAKAILDGIVAAGRHLTDDSDDIITGPDMRRDRPNGPLRVTITIEDIT